MLIFNILLSGFTGYLIGRWGHCYLNVWLNNPKWAPHHWLYGVFFIIIALIFFKIQTGVLIFFFGIGLVISDLKDLSHFRLIGPDEDGKKNFWGVD